MERNDQARMKSAEVTRLERQIKELKDRVLSMQAEFQVPLRGIWMEVDDGRYETSPAAFFVRLKGDRSQPTAAWWPVRLGSRDISEIYREFDDARDRKRLVLAHLTAEPGSGTLSCDRLSYRTAELGAR